MTQGILEVRSVAVVALVVNDFDDWRAQFFYYLECAVSGAVIGHNDFIIR